MLIGTIAITGVGIPLTHRLRGFLLQGRDHRERLRRARTPRRTSPSGCWSISALFTAFYSWRLVFMTFHGKPRGRSSRLRPCAREPDDHADPARRCWPPASIFAGMIWYKPFFGNHDAMNAWFGIPAHAEAADPAAERCGGAGGGSRPRGGAGGEGEHADARGSGRAGRCSSRPTTRRSSGRMPRRPGSRPRRSSRC